MPVDLRYRFPFNILLSLNGRYVADLFDFDIDDEYVRLPSYFVLHMKTSIRFYEHFRAFIDASNLTDKDYVHRFGYPREGRTIRFGVKLDLPQSL